MLDKVSESDKTIKQTRKKDSAAWSLQDVSAKLMTEPKLNTAPRFSVSQASVSQYLTDICLWDIKHLWL
jgi:hypothetical protein